MPSAHAQARPPKPPLADTIRVLIVPGLRDSGPAHWQSWLQTQYRGAVRVTQANWEDPDLQAWSARIAATLARHPAQTQWVAVAHSFGCLALAHHLAQQRQATGATQRIRTALMVAPADPVKFGLVQALPQTGLGLPLRLLASENDPWMTLAQARQWANTWGAAWQNLGQVGHVNTESGFGPWPLARFKVDEMIRQLQRQQRIERAHPMEFAYAV